MMGWRSLLLRRNWILSSDCPEWEVGKEIQAENAWQVSKATECNPFEAISTILCKLLTGMKGRNIGEQTPVR